MNKLFSRPWKRVGDDLQSGGGGGREMFVPPGAAAGASLDRFFEDVESIKDELQDLERIQRSLHDGNDAGKSLHEHDASAVHALRSRMDADVSAAVKKANVVKLSVESLDRANAANRSLPGCGPGSSTDRTRTCIVAGLCKKLMDSMESFSSLRARITSEYRDTVTGSVPDEATLDNLAETGSDMTNAAGEPKLMSLHLLEEITNGFSKHRKLGGGTYGNVYLGEHKNGEKIAVKLLKDVLDLDDEQFEKEYYNLASLDHKNIVRLVGYCHETQRECIRYNGRMIFAEKTKRALCFEYMHNGSLDNFIADESNVQNWSTRYAIIKGICEGLEYLHENLESAMYHLDLKPANVLLDHNMMPKIADFGLSRLFGGDKTQMTKSAIGTHGYVPPEYIDSAMISTKFDIFSLGVVIIKIITGRDGYYRSAEMTSQQFIDLVHRDWMNRLQATSVHTYSIQVRRCIEIALSCVEADRHKRPSIGVIVDNLNKTGRMNQLVETL